jgi:hypothetical protein
VHVCGCASPGRCPPGRSSRCRWRTTGGMSRPSCPRGLTSFGRHVGGLCIPPSAAQAWRNPCQPVCFGDSSLTKKLQAGHAWAAVVAVVAALGLLRLRRCPGLVFSLFLVDADRMWRRCCAFSDGGCRERRALEREGEHLTPYVCFFFGGGGGGLSGVCCPPFAVSVAGPPECAVVCCCTRDCPRVLCVIGLWCGPCSGGPRPARHPSRVQGVRGPLWTPHSGHRDGHRWQHHVVHPPHVCRGQGDPQYEGVWRSLAVSLHPLAPPPPIPFPRPR